MNRAINGVVVQYLTVDQLMAWMPREERFMYACQEGITFKRLNYLIEYFPNMVLKEVHIVMVTERTIGKVKWLPTSVRKIHLSGNFAKLVLPDHIVKVIDCKGCSNLSDILVCEGRVDLEEIDFSDEKSYFQRYIDLTCLATCTNLKKLALSGEFDALPLLSEKLTHLRLEQCSKLCELPPNLYEQLRNIRVRWCNSLENVTPFKHLRKICWEYNFDDFFGMDILSKCVHLRAVNITFLKKSVDIAFDKLLKVRNVSVYGKVEGLGSKHMLRNVNMRMENFDMALLNPLMVETLSINSKVVLNLHLLGGFERLRELEMRNCMDGDSTGVIDGKQLKVVRFFSCGKRFVDEMMSKLGQKVEKLVVMSCGNLIVENLMRLSGLRELCLWEYNEGLNILGMRELRRLERISICKCSLIEFGDVDVLGEIDTLKSVKIYACRNVGMGRMGEMRGKICVGKNGQQMDLVKIEDNLGVNLVVVNCMVKNVKVCFRGADSTKNVLSFGEMACVENINVINGVVDVVDVMDIRTVKSLDLRHCVLKNGENIGELGGLRNLSIVGCCGNFLCGVMDVVDMVGRKLESLTIDCVYVENLLESGLNVSTLGVVCDDDSDENNVLDLEDLFVVDGLRSLILKNLVVVNCASVDKFRDLEYVRFGMDCTFGVDGNEAGFIRTLYDHEVFIEIE